MAQKKTAASAVTTVKEAKADSTSIKKIETRKGMIVTIPGVRTERLTTLVVGTAPLIVHAFSQKARLKIRAKHEGEASGGREPKDCIANFEAARYRLSDGSDGIPASGLAAIVIESIENEEEQICLHSCIPPEARRFLWTSNCRTAPRCMRKFRAHRSYGPRRESRAAL